MTTSSAPCLVERLGKLMLVHVIGEVGVENYLEFAAALDDAARANDPAAVIVGFFECTYMDTSGLTVLVGAHRAYGKRLRLVVSPNSHIRRLFEVTGLHRVLLVHENFRSAIADATVTLSSN